MKDSTDVIKRGSGRESWEELGFMISHGVKCNSSGLISRGWLEQALTHSNPASLWVLASFWHPLFPLICILSLLSLPVPLQLEMTSVWGCSYLYHLFSRANTLFYLQTESSLRKTYEISTQSTIPLFLM